jgi:hypothetical protein
LPLKLLPSHASQFDGKKPIFVFNIEFSPF